MSLKSAAVTVLCAMAAAVAGCTAQDSVTSLPGQAPNAAVPGPLATPAASTAPATTAPKRGPVAADSTERITVDVGGRERSFVLSVPDGYTNHNPWPVVLAFHGWKEKAEWMHDYTGLDTAAAVVVYAEGVDQAWSPAPYATTSVAEDIAYVEAVLTWVREHYLIDDASVNAVGLSNGGGFATLLGCRVPEQIAAVATISAAYYQDVHHDCAEVPVPHLDVHGTADSVIEYYGGTRHDTVYSSVPEVLAAAAERNGCDEGAEIMRESTEVLEFRWPGCEAGLQHIRVGGGGHTWPGGREDPNVSVPEDFATYRVLEFFGVGWRM